MNQNTKHLYTELGATILSGSVTDNVITDNSVIEIYFDNTDVFIKTISQNGHTVSFTVDGNANGTHVCVVVNNLTDFVPFDGEGIENRVSVLESDINTIIPEIETLDNKVNNLSASTINYDEHSTLYSAMGDIDELETESKNLVGAINEVRERGGGGVIFENPTNNTTEVSDTIPQNTWTTTSNYLTLNKGIYYITISYFRSGLSTSDRGYIRVGNSNVNSSYQWFPYVQGITVISSIVKVSEDNTPIAMRISLGGVSIVFTKKCISYVKIGGVD